jgi:hypothetical protein
MTSHSYYAQDAALVQLETALRLYFDCDKDTGFFSVITLAGAAEEILGSLVRLREQKKPVGQCIDNALDLLKKAVVEMEEFLGESYATPEEREDAKRAAINRASRAKNSLKHLNGEFVGLDAREEARDMLNRAIDNYWLLEQKLTPAMERFQRELFRCA